MGSLRMRGTRVAVLAIVLWLAGAAGAQGQTTFDHVVVVMFENTDAGVAMGQPNFASFAAANSADTGVNQSPVSTGYHEFGAYPSLPNYLMFVSGSNQGCTTDACLTNGHANGAITPAYSSPTIFSQLGASGSQTLSELEPSNCFLANSGTSPNQYIVHHDPEVYFTSSSGFCSANNKAYPATGTIDLSPRFTLIVPSKCHQGHTPCTVTNANAWLGQELPRIRAALSGHWAVILTFDESATGGPKTAVYFAVQTSDGVHAQQPASATENDALATIDAELGLPGLGTGNPTLLAPFFGGLSITTTTTPQTHH
jgi:phosphatidylinositol-3-phosphatase